MLYSVHEVLHNEGAKQRRCEHTNNQSSKKRLLQCYSSLSADQTKNNATESF